MKATFAPQLTSVFRYKPIKNVNTGSLLLYLTAFLLFSPYLPTIWGLGRLRADHFLIYFLAIWITLTSPRRLKYNSSAISFIHFPLGVYILFLLWLLVITFLGPPNAPGCRDAVENGVTGLLSDVGDTESMAQNIIRLMENRKLLDRLVQNGKIKVSNYDWPKVASQYIKTYKEIV